MIAAMAACLKTAKGPTHFLMPTGGVQEWDKPGGPMHDPEGLAAMVRTASLVDEGGG